MHSSSQIQTNQHPPSYGPDALPVTQPTVSKHWREILTRCINNNSQTSSVEATVRLNQMQRRWILIFVKKHNICSLVTRACRHAHILRPVFQVNTESDDAHIYPGSYKEFSLQCFDTWFGQQEGHPACKKLDVGLSLVTIWLELYSAVAPVVTTHQLHHP